MGIKKLQHEHSQIDPKLNQAHTHSYEELAENLTKVLSSSIVNEDGKDVTKALKDEILTFSASADLYNVTSHDLEKKLEECGLLFNDANADNKYYVRSNRSWSDISNVPNIITTSKVVKTLAESRGIDNPIAAKVVYDIADSLGLTGNASYQTLETRVQALEAKFAQFASKTYLTVKD